ncbi:hypothetical protein L195_g047559, partial [Trifolium pratense]
MRCIGLEDLSITDYMYLDPSSISVFVDRWHKETSNFHLPNLRCRSDGGAHWSEHVVRYREQGNEESIENHQDYAIR